MNHLKRRTSFLWTFFAIVDVDKQLAKCNLCHQKLSYRTTITNLKKHIIRKHGIQFASNRDENFDAPIKSDDLSSQSVKCDITDQNNLTDLPDTISEASEEIFDDNSLMVENNVPYTPKRSPIESESTITNAVMEIPPNKKPMLVVRTPKENAVLNKVSQKSNMNTDVDDLEAFGLLVTSELRNIRSSRRLIKLKHKLISSIYEAQAEEEEEL